MVSLLIYPLLTATLYYLGSRAVITSFLWSKYPHKIAAFMDCSRCAGFWWGILVAIVGGYVYTWDFAGLDGKDWKTILLVGAVSITTTPIIEALAEHSTNSLGTAVSADDTNSFTEEIQKV